MGPFEYIHGWAKALQSTWGGLVTILAHQDLAETELIEALLSDTVEGLPSAETLWIQQFGIYGKCSIFSAKIQNSVSDMLEDLESNLDVMSLFFDSFITTQFYNLVAGPICGVTTVTTTSAPVTTALP